MNKRELIEALKDVPDDTEIVRLCTETGRYLPLRAISCGSARKATVTEHGERELFYLEESAAREDLECLREANQKDPGDADIRRYLTDFFENLFKDDSNRITVVFI